MERRIQYVTSSDGVRIAYATVGAGHPFVVGANVWGDIDLAFQRSGPIYGGLVDTLVRNGFRFASTLSEARMSLSDAAGQDLIEYALLAGLIAAALIVVVALTGIASGLSSMGSGIANCIDFQPSTTCEPF